MKIIRYSLTAFKPQYQSHHLDYVSYHFNDFRLSKIPEHLRMYVKEEHDRLVPFYKDNYDDFQYGVWAFIDGYKYNQALNHLKQRVPCWEANISDNTIVYSVNWDRKIPITDPLCKIFGFYIPVNQLKNLSEIKRRKVYK
jgi:hypothetical protein